MLYALELVVVFQLTNGMLSNESMTLANTHACQVHVSRKPIQLSFSSTFPSYEGRRQSDRICTLLQYVLLQYAEHSIAATDPATFLIQLSVNIGPCPPDCAN